MLLLGGADYAWISMTIARNQCVHMLMLHVNHNIQVYALRMQCMQYVHKYYDASYAAKPYTFKLHTLHMCVSNVCNLYGNTASYVSPHVCMDFIYEMYALCASHADAALYASKYLYVKPRKKVHDPFWSTLSLLHFIVCTMYILCAMCNVQCAWL